MKLNKNYIIKQLADETILVHQDEHNVDFTKIINLNELAVFIINKINENLSFNELVLAIINEYEIDKQTAENDTKEFVDKLISLGIVDE